jgi:hypothetical protein
VMRTSGATRMHSCVRERLTFCDSGFLPLSADPRTARSSSLSGCAACAVFPLILCYEIAVTSSRCDLLMDYLNAVRGRHIVQHPDPEKATRMDMELTRVEVYMYLKQLNCGQGLGFKIFGKVADKKTLLIAFTSLEVCWPP